jgi:acetolactate synthase I/II/III large subunit
VLVIKVSDYVAKFLVQHGVHDAFLVAGGGIMHLTESFGSTPGMRYWCCYHEQGCAIAAESYARQSGHAGACLVTTGPGSTNALSGIAGAWVDSIPVFVVSGQVRRDFIADYSKLRQVGPQEINIVDLARVVTKYAVTVMEPVTIRAELERAWYHMMTGRTGPVWVNIPLDVQGAMVDEESLEVFLPPASAIDGNPAEVASVVAALKESRRPVLICGNGIHLRHVEERLRSFTRKTRAVALCTFGGIDLFDEDDPLAMGRFGPVGQRRSNFALQNSDLLIALGASMSVASVGFNTKGFAPRAKRIMLNIDAHEFSKPNITPHVTVHADLAWFFDEFDRQTEGYEFDLRSSWLDACRRWKTDYPTLTDDYLVDSEHVNSYAFVHLLSDSLSADDTVITGCALDAASVLHSFRTKLGQRIYTNINYGALGWDVPAVVGACIARGGHRTILVTGDGSLIFNCQEMLTIGHNRLNVKIFVLNNGGYESIRATQSNFFQGHFVGSDGNSGVGNPDFSALAGAFGFDYLRVRDNASIRDGIAKALATDGPVLIELNVSYSQGRSPKIMSVRREDGTMESRPLEDMYPFLPREEVDRNMRLFDT